MEGRAVGRHGHLDAAGRRAGDPASQASEQVGAFVHSLVEGSEARACAGRRGAPPRGASAPAPGLRGRPSTSAIFQTEILDRALREPQVAGDRSAHSELVQLRQILERELDTLRVTRTIDEPDGGRKWQLEVGDDGRGFDIDGVTAHPNRRHFGLRFMRERADLLGSELPITTSPAAGTVVRLTTDIGG